MAFLLRTAGRYLQGRPTAADVLSVFAGVRPLISRGETRVTAALSRDHTIEVDRSGLITTTGGKWTTYRHMAEQTVDRAAAAAGLPRRVCTTATLRIHGFDRDPGRHGALSTYGADAPGIAGLVRERPELGVPLDDALPCIGAEVVWAARNEMARTVEDVLARRCRALFLDARSAARMAPAAAALLAGELHRDADWQRRQVRTFEGLARGYFLTGNTN